MKGIKLGILGICISLLGIALSTYNFFAICGAAVGLLLSIIGFVEKNQ